MEFAIILLVIFWVIVPMVAKNSQKKAKAEEERRRAVMRQQAPQPQRAQQPMRTTPIAPTIRQPMHASSEGASSDEGNFSGSMDGTSRKNASFNTQQVTSTLMEAKSSITHTVSVSQESGHAHEETSASGIQEECPPEKASARQTAQTQAPTENAFTWNTNAVRSGLVMAEILGPCLANRD